MSPYEKFPTAVLLELLMFESEKLSKMFKASVIDQDYDEAKKIVEDVQGEIERRNLSAKNTITKHIPFEHREITDC